MGTILDRCKSVKAKVGDREFDNLEAAAIYARDNNIKVVSLSWVPLMVADAADVGKGVKDLFFQYTLKGTGHDSVQGDLMWHPNNIAPTSVDILGLTTYKA